jgi:hypothetical protein
MAYINIDVDLDDIDTEDLVSELIDRIKQYKRGSWHKMSAKDRANLKDAAEDILLAINNTPTSRIPVLTLDDKIKYDHIVAVWNKFTAAQIQMLLPT